jgi:hypothetical protein
MSGGSCEALIPFLPRLCWRGELTRASAGIQREAAAVAVGRGILLVGGGLGTLRSITSLVNTIM